MLKDLSNRVRVIGLLIIILLFFALTYFLAIRRTWLLIKENEKLKRDINLAKRAPIKIKELKNELEDINQFLDRYSTETGDFDILSIMSELCDQHSVNIKNLKEPVELNEGEKVIGTLEIEVEGKYINLVKIIYALENEDYNVALISTDFDLQENKRSKEEFLIASLYFQSVIHEENENTNNQ